MAGCVGWSTTYDTTSPNPHVVSEGLLELAVFYESAPMCPRCLRFRCLKTQKLRPHGGTSPSKLFCLRRSPLATSVQIFHPGTRKTCIFLDKHVERARLDANDQACPRLEGVLAMRLCSSLRSNSVACLADGASCLQRCLVNFCPQVTLRLSRQRP